MQISAGSGFKVANALVSAQPNKGNLKRRIVNLHSLITYIVNVNIIIILESWMQCVRLLVSDVRLYIEISKFSFNIVTQHCLLGVSIY